jgi:hypothetical protein
MIVWFTPIVSKRKGHGLIVPSNEEGVLARSTAFIASIDYSLPVEHKDISIGTERDSTYINTVQYLRSRVH